ncbi:phage major capsid protein, P2 family [Sphingomonas sp.]|uniref:phage major capsid protein, P2 family n=1 Tax=Sphingomonas sp. TaxID=28214 RepID=UPI003B3B2FCA
MKNTTRIAFAAYVSQIALLSGVTAAEGATSINFAVEPSIQQKLEQKTQETSTFLQQINMETVTELKGEKLGLGIGGPVASRTDTSGAGERSTTDPTALEAHGYECRKTNSDTHIKYAKLDQWAKFADFQTKIRDLVLKRQGLDRIMIGWNGRSAAATTDKVANPLLQDVNIGWLQQIRANAPARWISDGELTADATKAIYVSDAGTADYKSLDALATDAVKLLDPWAQDDTELVVILGRDLLDDKYFPIINNAGSKATEVVARDQILRSAKQVGGMPAVRVPFFPAGAMLITRLDNLSIYTQEGSRRRAVKDNPKKDQVENYESWNEAYVVEDYGYVAFVENIVMGPKPA